KQYAKLFSMDGAKLRFTRDGICAIAEKALILKTGARALRSIMERVMLDVMYDLPQLTKIAEIVVNRAVVEGRAQPKLKKISKNLIKKKPSKVMDSSSSSKTNPADAA
ncbi:MAG: ATP-dependent Clp protease ATP-binding subunit ClpX, partial [Verrucomicrobiota bacterium]|nr:ATP-dependent Clp protease ATP-binding subunit ClpX [Verrucomicrobiota bacterium]